MGGRLPTWIDLHLQIDYGVLPLVKDMVELLSPSSAHSGVVLLFRLYETRHAPGESLLGTIARFDDQLTEVRRQADDVTTAFLDHTLGSKLFYTIVNPYTGPGQNQLDVLRLQFHNDPRPRCSEVRGAIDELVRTHGQVFTSNAKLFEERGAAEVQRQHEGAYDRARSHGSKKSPQDDKKDRPQADGPAQANLAWARDRKPVAQANQAVGQAADAEQASNPSGQTAWSVITKLLSKEAVAIFKFTPGSPGKPPSFSRQTIPTKMWYTFPMEVRAAICTLRDLAAGEEPKWI